MLRHHSEQDRTSLQLQVAALQGDLAAQNTQLAAAVHERDASMTGWRDEATRRIAAEQSEQRALRLATKQVGTGTMLPCFGGG